MLYFEGNLSEKDCIFIEKITQRIQLTKLDLEDNNNISKKFIDIVKENLNISLIEKPIEHVFRIRDIV